MIDLKGKKVAILGWGTDTQDVYPYLVDHGAVVDILDEKKGKDFNDLSGYDLVVRSPGVYRFREEIEIAEKKGAVISSKTKLFFDAVSDLPAGRQAKIIGVTGTKGKGTTATLIYEILKSAGKDVFLGGNIGTGIFHFLPRLTKESWVILELSSFQLIDLEKSPQIAVVLMVTTEHLDWHISTQEYVDAKKNIVSHQKKTDLAVINSDYPNSAEIGKVAKGKVTWVSKEALKNMMPGEVGLRGEHNRENIVAAATVAMLIGIKDTVIRQVIKNFKGLEHRLEEVKTVGGVTFYNDSFSTVPETAIAAIKSFHEPEIVILGGSEKGSDFTKLGKVISQTPNIKAVILIGLMADRIEKAIKRAGTSNRVQIIKNCKNMEEIVKTAYNKAVPGDVVLLTPAAASFDMFKNYKERGTQFKFQVNNL